MPLHAQPHPFAGLDTRVAAGAFEGRDVTVLDWYDRVTGRSWRRSGVADPAAHAYAFRSIYAGLPLDDAVVLGILHHGAELLHDSELPAPLTALAAPECEARS